jgi:hypothetical protein
MKKKFYGLVATIVVLLNIVILVYACTGSHPETEEGTVKEELKTENSLTGNSVCRECHSQIDTLKVTGFHKSVSCEACHGSATLHLSDPIVYKMNRPAERDLCASCHANDSSAAAGVKQIDIAAHNKGKKCIQCHDPHHTGFGRLAGDSKNANSSACTICHAKINNTRLKGVHKNVECQSCHAGWEKHLDSPRASKPGKSTERASCAKCHGKGVAQPTGNTKLVDMNEHNSDAKCIDCHNAHSPWD